MGKKSRKKGADKAARKEKLNIRREQQLQGGRPEEVRPAGRPVERPVRQRQVNLNTNKREYFVGK